MADETKMTLEQVREAWKRIIADEQYPEDFECIRAELLRLYAENSANVKSLNMLYGEKFSDRTYAALKSRMEHAEAELAKLQARIADAPTGFWTAAMPAYVCLPSDWMSIVTKWHDLDRVRLVVEDGE
jgi:hypothetical protein